MLAGILYTVASIHVFFDDVRAKSTFEDAKYFARVGKAGAGAAYLAAFVQDPSNPEITVSAAKYFLKEDPVLSFQLAQIALASLPVNDEALAVMESSLEAIILSSNEKLPWTKGRFRKFLRPWVGNSLLPSTTLQSSIGIKVAESSNPLAALPFLFASFLNEPDRGNNAGNLGVAIVCSVPGNCPTPPKYGLLDVASTATQKLTMVYCLRLFKWVEHVRSINTAETMSVTSQYKAAEAILQRLVADSTIAVPDDTTKPPESTLFNTLLPECLEGQSWCKQLKGMELLLDGLFLAHAGLVADAAVYLHHASSFYPDNIAFRFLAASAHSDSSPGEAAVLYNEVVSGTSADSTLHRVAKMRLSSLSGASHHNGTTDVLGDISLEESRQSARSIAKDMIKEVDYFESVMTAFVERQQRLISSRGSSSDGFIVLHIPHMLGLGNRLMSLASAFILALVTERGLLVNWNDYEVPLEELFSLPGGLVYDLRKYQRLISVNELLTMTSGATTISFGEEYEKQATLVTLACDDLRDTYARYKYVHFCTNMWMPPIAAANPHHEEMLHRLFYSVQHNELRMFQLSSQFFLQPRPATANAVNSFIATHYRPRSFRMALHLRVGTTYLEDRSRKGLPHFISREATLQYVSSHVDCIMSILKTHVLPNQYEDVVLLITADQNYAREHASTVIRQAAATFPLPVRTVHYEGTVERQTAAGIMHALTEWFLLSQSDFILRHRFSTYSVTSSSYGDVISYEHIELPGCPSSCNRLLRLEPRLGTLPRFFASRTEPSCFAGGWEELVTRMGDSFYPMVCQA